VTGGRYRPIGRTQHLAANCNAGHILRTDTASYYAQANDEILVIVMAGTRER